MPGAGDGLTVVSAMRHAEPILRIKSEPMHRLRKSLTGRLGLHQRDGLPLLPPMKTVLDMFVSH